MKKLKLLIFAVTYSILLIGNSCATKSVTKKQTPVIKNTTLSLHNLQFNTEGPTSNFINENKLPILWQNNTDNVILYANDFDLYFYDNNEFRFLKRNDFYKNRGEDSIILPFQNTLVLYDMDSINKDEKIVPGKYKLVSRCFYNNVVDEVQLLFEIK